MRHKNIYKNTHGWSRIPGREYLIDHPYQQLYCYTRPSMAYRYMQVIQWVANHPGMRRRDIIEGVYGYKPSTSGHHSAMFANLLCDDVIDYDGNFRYTVTPAGEKLLHRAYLNDCEKLNKQQVTWQRTDTVTSKPF